VTDRAFTSVFQEGKKYSGPLAGFQDLRRHLLGLNEAHGF
jgi:hypothetical protein